MYRHIAVIALMLFAVFPVVVSASNHEGGDEISQANRFLSAETQRVIREELDSVQGELQAYQDENFAILDGRISTFIEDSQWKIGLVGAGAGFIAMAIGALLMMRSFKKHSVAQVRRSQQEMEEIVQQVQDRVTDELENYMKSEWHPQPQAQTVSTQYGQAQAERMSQMNAWQAQSAHRDSWKAPVEVENEAGSATARLENSYGRNRPEWQQPVQQEEWQQEQQEDWQQQDYYDEGYYEQGYEEQYDGEYEGYDADQEYSGMEKWAEELLNKDDDEDGWL